jgi:hypothetical protein
MANQYVNKLIKDGVTKFDLSGDTVTPETLAEGVTAHDKSGKSIVGSLRITTWSALQLKVRNNDMSDVFISDQYSCVKGGSPLVFDVIAKNNDTPASSLYTNTLTLRTHFQLPDTMQFDAPEAFYYCSYSISAGNKYIEIGKYTKYQFTLTKPVPLGGQLVFVDQSAKQVASYSSATSKTPIEIVSISEGTTGTFLGRMQYHAKSGNFNTYYRALYGNSNWRESAIRQWLNSNKIAGEWWQPQNNWDRPPDYADTMNGFMYDLDPDFIEVIGRTSKITARNTVSDGGGTDTTEDLFFLLSQTEVYGGQISGIDEGQAYTFYSENSTLSAPGTNSDANRITYRNGSANRYWLRTPNVIQSGDSYFVDSNGSISQYPSNSSFGVVLACNII